MAGPKPAANPTAARLVLTVATLFAIAVLGLLLGYRPIDTPQVWVALSSYDARNPDHIVLAAVRFPRVVAAVLAGAALGVAGTMMQSMTRNALADPGLLGVNAGAALGAVLSIAVLGITDPGGFVWIALGGAFLATLLVFLLGGGAQAHPVRIVLAGAAVTALSLALIRSVLLLSSRTLETYRIWVLGGFDGVSLADIDALAPFFMVGFGLAALAGFWLNAMMLGQDVARALGLRVGLIWCVAGLSIVLLCGASVAMAGPIAFVGLIVPHLARRIAGPDVVWTMLFSACFGAILLILSDLIGRLAILGGNLPAGIMSALIGGPLLIWFVRQKTMVRL
ncbi:MAG: iron ABC transporter permease [Pseudomonadota bacterium]